MLVAIFDCIVWALAISFLFLDHTYWISAAIFREFFSRFYFILEFFVWSDFVIPLKFCWKILEMIPRSNSVPLRISEIEKDDWNCSNKFNEWLNRWALKCMSKEEPFVEFRCHGCLKIGILTIFKAVDICMKFNLALISCSKLTLWMQESSKFSW